MKKLLLFIAMLLISSLANAYYEQVLKHTDEDGITRWTDVYSGPEGEGKIEWEQKVEDDKTFVKSTHTGPEARSSFDWTEVNSEIPNV